MRHTAILVGCYLGRNFASLIFGVFWCITRLSQRIEDDTRYAMLWFGHHFHGMDGDAPRPMYRTSTFEKTNEFFEVKMTIALLPHVNSGEIHVMAAQHFDETVSFVDTEVSKVTKMGDETVQEAQLRQAG